MNNIHSNDSSKVILDISSVTEDSVRKIFQPDSLTIISGYFNSDKVIDSAHVLGPYVHKGSGWCAQCVTSICFNNNIDTLFIPYQAVGAAIFNLGDLDGSGTEEILVIPDWFNSCWGTQYVYSFINNKWDTLATSQVYRCKMYKRIYKIGNGTFDMIVDDGPGGERFYKKRIELKN